MKMKKKIILISFLILNFNIFCQVPSIVIDSINTGQNFEDIFENLDKSKIKAGILYDKVIPFANIYKFDGKDSIGIATLNEWKQIYFEMKKGTLDTTNFLSLEIIFRKAYNNYIKQNIIPIGIINLKYNQIKEGASEENLLYWQDGKIYDNPLAKSSPYEEKRVFAITTFRDKIHLGENKFIITEDFCFSNDTMQIDHFEIDFDDGNGFNIYYKNGIINIYYQTAGEKIIKLKTKSSNNTELTGWLKIKVTDCGQPDPDVKEKLFTSTIPCTTCTNTGNINDIPGQYGQAKVSIWYASENNILTKPFILLDGFDPFVNDVQDRHWEELYCDAHQVYTIDTLRARCYDIITVDWVGGADWIQKNAFCLVEILKWINNNKVGFNKNIIVGPSMGGIIGRYALSYMEKNNISHDVGVFIPWDSPHRGANIALGLQYFTDYYADDSNFANESKKSINSPAAKQLLNYHYLNNCGSHSLRNQLVSELNSLGNYPTEPILIGVANGSGIGTFQNNGSGNIMYPRSEILEMTTKEKILGTWIQVARAYVYALPDVDYNDWSTIFYGTKFLNSVEVEVKGTYPYDNAPGGYFPHLKEIEGSTTEDNTKTAITVFNPYVCFIPTISALDLDHSINNLYYSSPDESQTPFDYIIYTKQPAYYNPGDYGLIYQETYPDSWNENHSSITHEKRNFIVDIIENNFSEDLFIQNEKLFYPVVSGPVYIQAINTITAGYNVDNTQTPGNVVILAGNDVTFRAGKKITLKSGFKTELGAKFHAVIGVPILTCEIFKMKNLLFTSFNNDENTNISYLEKKQNRVLEKTLNLYNYPNPFKETTNLYYTLNESDKVSLIVYDLYGRELIKLIDNQYQEPGPYCVTIHANNLQPGVYLYKLQVGDYIENNKFIIYK